MVVCYAFKMMVQDVDARLGSRVLLDKGGGGQGSIHTICDEESF